MRIAACIAGGLLVLIAILFVCIVELVHTDAFHQYLLHIAQMELSKTAGIQLRMRDYSLHLSVISPSVDMYDVVLDGERPSRAAPLLTVNHLRIGIQIVSLVQRKWYLKDIVIDHPVARVFVDGNGDTNLPAVKSSDQTTGVFDLGVDQVILAQGEVYYNTRTPRSTSKI
jgi:translocation and assembly module TamB